MTTITKERLLTIKQWRETYGPGSNVVLPAEEAEELARIALASLEAEPVASCIIEDGCMCVDGFVEYVGHSLPDGTHQLYAAHPAPVVPAVLERLRSIVADPRALPRRKEWVSGQQYSYVLLENVEAMVDEACRAAMLYAGNFRENANSSTNNFREIAETSTNSPVIPGEVLSAILKFARVRADFDDFDGDRRGISDCLDEAEWELIVTINKHASQIAAKPSQEEKSGNADCTATSGKADNPQASGKQVNELTMLVKRLASSLKSVNKSSYLPDKAMEYLKQNGLVGVEDILR